MINSELRSAIEQGDLASVLCSLEKGADIELADIHSSNAHGAGAPIRMAARARHDELVRLLLAHGAEMPSDLKSQFTDTGERRKRSDQRRHSYGPPTGLKDRRCTLDRRVTFVREVELSDFQWVTYFSQSLVKANAEPQQDHDHADVASLVFERIRD